MLSDSTGDEKDGSPRMPAAEPHHSPSQVDLHNVGFFFLFPWAGSRSRGLRWWIPMGCGCRAEPALPAGREG